MSRPSLSKSEQELLRQLLLENPKWGRRKTRKYVNEILRSGLDPVGEKCIRNFFDKIGHRSTEKGRYAEGASLNKTHLRRGGREVEANFGDKRGSVTIRSLDIKTIEDLIEFSDIDLSIWEVERFSTNSWEVTMGGRSSGTGEPETYTNYQVKAFLRKKAPEVRAAQDLLDEIQNNSVAVSLPRKFQRIKSSKMFEVSLFDPHLGLHCFKPGSDHTWSLDQCESMCMEALERLLVRADKHGPFEYILFPFGNDFLHADNVFHTTTAGTPQPEADSWHQVYVRAEQLALGLIERMKKVAPVRVVVVPGNHSRHTEFTLGRLINAYYHNDDTVTVDASASPYKFEHYGTNLIGFEHGHSVAPVRLAALMANECRDIWHLTSYREWHLGDQHRKGSAKPSMLEEQGVSIDYLPGLTPPNEWHRLKSFNWQKRGAMGFVWDKTMGQEARFLVNIDSYTGEFMGD